MSSFNIVYNYTVNRLTSACFVSSVTVHTKPENLRCKAVWDTGATMSCISRHIVEALGLIPVKAINVSGVGGRLLTNAFIVSISLPNDITFPFITVPEGFLEDSDVLIGMDIISKGDLVISNEKGETSFSFRTPPDKRITF